MNFTMSKFASRTIFFAILVMTLCGCGEDTPVNTTTPIEIETGSDTPILSPTSTEVVVVEASPTITEQPDLPTATATTLPEAPLSEEGPWLLFVADPEQDPPADYLWAINPDGTGLTQLSSQPTHCFEVSDVLGPNGEITVAYLTLDRDTLSNPQLSILKMPGGETEVTIDLTSPETAYTGQKFDTEEFNTVAIIVHAIKTDNSFKWSPDGKWLAFVGAIDGPSADVYSYELATGAIRQLTDGKDHAFQLLWSPDSAWILHTAKAVWGTSGGFYEPVTGVWAASPGGEQVIKLDGNRATYFIGWISPDTVVAYSGGAMGFLYDFRTINIASGIVEELKPVCFNELAYSLEHNIYLVYVNPYSVEACQLTNPWSEGLFLVAEGDIQQISDISYQLGDILLWSSEADMFLLGSSTGITPEGEIITELTDSMLDPSTVISADGTLRAWWASGHLYAASAPDYEPYPVLTNEPQLESQPIYNFEWVVP